MTKNPYKPLPKSLSRSEREFLRFNSKNKHKGYKAGLMIKCLNKQFEIESEKLDNMRQNENTRLTHTSNPIDLNKKRIKFFSKFE